MYSAVIERAATDPGIGQIITTVVNPFAQNSENTGNPLLPSGTCFTCTSCNFAFLCLQWRGSTMRCSGFRQQSL